jgi:excisionase family DNA binding protein
VEAGAASDSRSSTTDLPDAPLQPVERVAAESEHANRHNILAHGAAQTRMEPHVSSVTKLTEMTPGPGEPLQHYSVPYVAQMLAISERAAWNLIQAGKLRPTRVGRTTRIARREVERFVDQHAGCGLGPRAPR